MEMFQQLKNMWLYITFRSPDVASMHQDTSDDYEVVDEKLKEIFGVSFYSNSIKLIKLAGLKQLLHLASHMQWE